MPDELDSLKLHRKVERKLFLQTLNAIDEQLELRNYEKAKYVIEQTYLILTQYPIKDGEVK